jgi:imidazoleglycerol phosphate synthase glutamine amidotransferase subunit HisH
MLHVIAKNPDKMLHVIVKYPGVQWNQVSESNKTIFFSLFLNLSSFYDVKSSMNNKTQRTYSM